VLESFNEAEWWRVRPSDAEWGRVMPSEGAESSDERRVRVYIY
jgi:hypothetical protein